MSRRTKVTLLVIASVCGFFLMWPLGLLFDKMNWAVFHSWGLAHGSFFIAWPLLAWAVYLVLTALFRTTASRNERE